MGAYYTLEECATIIAHYEFEKRTPGYCGPGRITSRRLTEEQYLAIANRIVEEMGFDWLTEDVWVREEINRLKSKLSKLNVSSISSPFYRYNSPRLPLPENVEQIRSEIQQRILTLQAKLEKRVQKVGRGSRQKQAKRQTVYA